MATMQHREVATDTDLESYQTVAALVSKEFSKTMKSILDALRDPATFEQHVSTLAREHDVSPAAIADPPAVYKAFWNHASGLQADLRWLNSAGVPERSSQDVQAFAPIQPPTDEPSAQFDLGVGFLGFNVGIHV
jgi:hypothetical protein